MTTINPVPAGYPSLIPYVAVKEAARVLDFVKAVFDAQPADVLYDEAGRLNHAEIRIGDSMLMLTEGRDDFFTPASLYCYVPDVDAAYARAIAAGGATIHEPMDMFYGDRSAGVRDAGGNQWWLSARIEEVKGEELARRLKAHRS